VEARSLVPIRGLRSPFDQPALINACLAGIRCRPLRAFSISTTLPPALIIDYGPVSVDAAPVIAHEIANQFFLTPEPHAPSGDKRRVQRFADRIVRAEAR
jgi:hypothetical protein